MITVGSIHGGTKRNIIGDQRELQLTVRSNTSRCASSCSPASTASPRRRALRSARRDAARGDPLHDRNHAADHQRRGDRGAGSTSAFVDQLRPGDVIEQPRDGMGAEDFAYFVAPEHRVKGVYFAVGGTPPSELARRPRHHSPLFKIQPEPAVKAGVEAMVVGALTLLAR